MVHEVVYIFLHVIYAALRHPVGTIVLGGAGYAGVKVRSYFHTDSDRMARRRANLKAAAIIKARRLLS